MRKAGAESGIGIQPLSGSSIVARPVSLSIRTMLLPTVSVSNRGETNTATAMSATKNAATMYSKRYRDSTL
jgi:hypothetical protein